MQINRYISEKFYLKVIPRGIDLSLYLSNFAELQSAAFLHYGRERMRVRYNVGCTMTGIRLHANPQPLCVLLFVYAVIAQ